jgi:hypothetical protein
MVAILGNNVIRRLSTPATALGEKAGVPRQFDRVGGARLSPVASTTAQQVSTGFSTFAPKAGRPIY